MKKDNDLPKKTIFTLYLPPPVDKDINSNARHIGTKCNGQTKVIPLSFNQREQDEKNPHNRRNWHHWLSNLQ